VETGTWNDQKRKTSSATCLDCLKEDVGLEVEDLNNVMFPTINIILILRNLQYFYNPPGRI